MSLYEIKLFRGETLVQTRDVRGSCTGVFQGNGYGYFATAGYDTVTVELSYPKNTSEGFYKGMAKTPLMQALVPGIEYVGTKAELDYNENKRMIWKFPGVDVLPSDQVICAMRIINSWGNGYFQESVKKLREYELTVNECMIICMFGCNHPRDSDGMPSLWFAPKSVTQSEEFKAKDRFHKPHHFTTAKVQPCAGMLLPLLRGEIKPGWQPTLHTGYMKEHCVVDHVIQNAYSAKAWYDACPDDASPSVNHPLIHSNISEGPILQQSDAGLRDVAEWVLTKLGK